MLVETLTKNTLEMQGFRVVEVKVIRDRLEAVLAPDRRYSPRCNVCGHKAFYRDTRPARKFRHVPLWGIEVFLSYAPRRVTCSHCGGIFSEALPWASGQRRFTKALMVTLATWARVLTWKQVARLFRCAWGTVAAAVDEAIQHGLAHRDLSEVTLIGIDEISRKRDHVYVTNVYDLDGRRLIWSGEDATKTHCEISLRALAPSRPRSWSASVAICGSLTSMSSRKRLRRLFWCSTSFISCSISPRRWIR